MGRWLTAARALSREGEIFQNPSTEALTKLTKPGSVGFVSPDSKENRNFSDVVSGVAKLANPPRLPCSGVASDKLSAAANVGAQRASTLAAHRAATCPSALDERAGMAADGIPAVYLDAWATLQCVPPCLAPADAWQQAIEDAGMLLDQWGGRLAAFGWPAVAIFGPDGLAWFVRGEMVQAVGPDHAITAGDRIYDRRGGTPHA